MTMKSLSHQNMGSPMLETNLMVKRSATSDGNSAMSRCSSMPETYINSTPQHKVSQPNGNVSKPLHKSASFPFVSMTTRDAVPVLFQEEHIETGFRSLGAPWYSYVLSVFQLHNESMNMWTHMLAVTLMTAKLIKFSYTVKFFDDPYSWPMLAGLICGILLYACSTGAHCMQSKSEMFHYTAFMIDYAGIGIYGLGSVIVHIEYCSEDAFYQSVHGWFIPVGCLMAFGICFCCTISKVMYTRPYPFSRKLWQITPVAAIYFLLISPIAHRLFFCFWYSTDCNESIPLHIQQIIWFCLSGTFFASDFPQRLKHGLCDLFFHSHQLFHVCIMICTLCQMDAVYIDFMTRREIVTGRIAPTLMSAFGPVVLTILSEFISISLFRMSMAKKLAEKRD